MIRRVELRDIKDIAAIYNHYVAETDISFESEKVSEEEMQSRIQEIAGKFPYFVFEADGKIAGYCYAHPWKEKAAYKYTLETTVYLSPDYTGRGIGKSLMVKLIEECRKNGFQTLIACITEGNEASYALHKKMGYRQVSHFEKVGFKFNRWIDVVDYELIL